MPVDFITWSNRASNLGVVAASMAKAAVGTSLVPVGDAVDELAEACPARSRR
jgi:hypothetical protein